MNRYIILSMMLFVCVGTTAPAAAEWWDGDWDYKQRITINNTQPSDLVDSYVEVVIDASQCYWSDCSDMRFVNVSSGQEIDFYCDADIGGFPNTTTTEKIYLEVPRIEGGGYAYIDFYFGNINSVPNRCSGSGTLSFTETFSDGDGYLDRWVPIGVGCTIIDDDYYRTQSFGTWTSGESCNCAPCPCLTLANAQLKYGYYGDRYTLAQPDGASVSFRYRNVKYYSTMSVIYFGCNPVVCQSGTDIHTRYMSEAWADGVYTGLGGVWGDGNSMLMDIEFLTVSGGTGSPQRAYIDDIDFQQNNVYMPSYVVGATEEPTQSYIVLRDSNENLVQHAHVSIHNLNTHENTHLWEDVDDGIIDMGCLLGDFVVAVRTFDGVFVHTCEIGTTPVCNITIPINYNIDMHITDVHDVPIHSVFCGMSEYTPLNPLSFWGMDLSDRGYVPVTNCSGFAMCDIIAEKDGYIDYNVSALNWTSRSAMIKDYRHNIVMEAE